MDQCTQSIEKDPPTQFEVSHDYNLRGIFIHRRKTDQYEHATSTIGAHYVQRFNFVCLIQHARTAVQNGPVRALTVFFARLNCMCLVLCISCCFLS